MMPTALQGLTSQRTRRLQKPLWLKQISMNCRSERGFLYCLFLGCLCVITTSVTPCSFPLGQDQVNNMKKELDKYRVRCERLEREKDELSNKKFRSIGMNGGTGSESMRLQQKIRELETCNEDLLDDKKSAELRVAELERELESRPSSAQTHKV